MQLPGVRAKVLSHLYIQKVEKSDVQVILLIGIRQNAEFE
ncbi:hypothetical protein B6N60_00553 [Richelia sinica FACHB-800]|uniref:Uncharacterized protein n=1 Tax=Richelia sinica FACHB-800 TaxID=1357546 RepID=A0A975T4N1_9NOST|nr:hypothetical protein B6N60_00553 [Richelia sinica FACHB-800]